MVCAISSLTRDQTHIPCIGSVESNHWITTEVPGVSLIYGNIAGGGWRTSHFPSLTFLGSPTSHWPEPAKKQRTRELADLVPVGHLLKEDIRVEKQKVVLRERIISWYRTSHSQFCENSFSFVVQFPILDLCDYLSEISLQD